MGGQEHLGHRGRLREKIASKGFESLFPHEQLEFILFGAFPQGDTNALAHRLISTFGSLEKVFKAPVSDLLNVNGIGDAAALLLKSYEFMAPLLCDKIPNKMIVLKTLGDLRWFLNPFFQDKTREEFHVLLLDKSFKLIKHVIMASPIMNQIYVDMAQVMSEISLNNPSAIVFAHNHPSGNPYPSTNDIEFTKKYFTAISLAFNITISEHMIFTSYGDCYSFRNGGLLENMRIDIEKNNGLKLADKIILGDF
ncbi:MAG: JAB domain-containing protein [Clostridia bacterium]